MTITASAADLTDAYEALRAQAVGEMPGVTPRGRAVLVGAGLAAWMAALPPPESSSTTAPSGCANRHDLRRGHDSQMVRLLAEMVSSATAGCSS